MDEEFSTVGEKRIIELLEQISSTLSSIRESMKGKSSNFKGSIVIDNGEIYRT